MNKNQAISFLSFNTMGLFSLDSFRGFFNSVNARIRQKKIAELLYKDDSDIIALQEVHTFQFLKLLKSTLKSHPYVAYKPLLYGPRGSLVIFSKIPFTDIEYIDFKDRGSIFNTSIVAILRRSGMLKIKIENQNIYIINVHLTQNGDYIWNDKSKFYQYIKSQQDQVIRKSKDILGEDSQAQIISLGDFNTDKKSNLYKNFLKSSNFSDVFAEKSTPSMHQDFLPDKKQVRRIDYVFFYNQLNKPKIIAKSELFKEKYLLKRSKMRYLSDHIGLKAVIEF